MSRKESISLVNRSFSPSFMYTTVIFLILVFMSPESATTDPWRQVFGSRCFVSNLAIIAVDEAHCIVEWLVNAENN